MSTHFFVAALAAVSMMATSVAANTELYADEARQRAFIKSKIREHFPESYPTMLAIAYCETRSRPFIHWEPDGQLRPHDTGASSAAGAFQVLQGYHREAIARSGLNLKDIDEYLEFVKILQGGNPNNFAPWRESKGCWKSRVADFATQTNNTPSS